MTDIPALGMTCFLCCHWLYRLALLALFCLTLPACSGEKPETCGAGVPRHAKHPYTKLTCPIAGRMGDIKLAIPKQYQFTEIGYKGFDLWRKETYQNVPPIPTLESELSYFTIMVRRNNFKPIESWADWEDVRHFENNQKTTPLEKRWIWVSFRYRGKLGQPSFDCPEDRKPCPPEDAKFGSPVKWWDQFDEARYGKLLRDPNLAWGLQHYISANPPSSDYGKFQREYFVDKKLSTYIGCENGLQSPPRPNPMTSCTMSFFLPAKKNNDLIEVEVALLLQSKADVSDWPDLIKGITNLFNSFIIR